MLIFQKENFLNNYLMFLQGRVFKINFDSGIETAFVVKSRLRE